MFNIGFKHKHALVLIVVLAALLITVNFASPLTRRIDTGLQKRQTDNSTITPSPTPTDSTTPTTPPDDGTSGGPGPGGGDGGPGGPGGP
ncbi:hypothetical protein RirG_164120 [Rhizophagus irregularis DAOM 197198w]|uniref:Uncharacterized protein n=1 Tax=Rhizophagus irregularis (strain DAOM 197198w) TaxID=1432141 RepID=A0A015M5W0_RHIIW|nr:hypothetical protein RirG_164120 [Rhizophagus irregularis DAOM 197198w]